jgi:hypothetical protein
MTGHFNVGTRFVVTGHTNSHAAFPHASGTREVKRRTLTADCVARLGVVLQVLDDSDEWENDRRLVQLDAEERPYFVVTADLRVFEP